MTSLPKTNPHHPELLDRVDQAAGQVVLGRNCAGLHDRAGPKGGVRGVHRVAQLASHGKVETFAHPDTFVLEGQENVSVAGGVNALIVVLLIGLAALQAVVLAREGLLVDVEEAAR